ncbi:hypothetical protein [Dokdonia sp. Dokd-P16]|uniref:hypothetical protein n=1 Tax=Dokdonia sp. Dokd-P16 TaxID=2173169 RepID=UPI0013A54C18|nr:hypothetical protein [Dokdonia sp. Dokd-P16]
MKYEDYSEDDFNEVQGLIMSAVPDGDPFNRSSVKNTRYQYHLDQTPPLIGFENIDMFEAQRGYPLIVLVHKEDVSISFYGRVGILDSLNTREKSFLKKHFQEELEKME